MHRQAESSSNTHQLLSLYAAMVACDSAIIRSKQPNDLFQQICRHLVQDGGVSFAWVGLTDAEGEKAWPQAHFGEGWSYFDFMQLAAKVQELPRTGLVDLAIKENRPLWSGDLMNEPSMSDRREIIKDRGWNSAAILPLAIGGRARGVLSIYSVAHDGFGEKARELLVQLALNLSHAMDFFELDAQRKQAEFELQESEVRYSALFSSNSMPMLVVDPVDGRILDANIRAVNFYGWDQNTLLSMSMSDINALSDDELRYEMELAASEKRTYINARHRLASGDLRDVEVFGNPISFGGRVHLVSAVHDVTERRSLEMRVQTSKSILQRFIDQLPGTVFVKDEQLRLVLVNRQLAKQLQMEPQDLVGKTAQDIFPPEFAKVVTEIDAQMFKDGGNHTFEEIFAGRHNDTSMFVMDTGTGQKLLGGISFDVTEQYHARERTNAQLKINEIGSQLPEKEFLTQGLELAEQLTHSKIGFLHFVNEDQETLELVTWTSSALKGCTAGYDNHYPDQPGGHLGRLLANQSARCLQ
jgi:PAS domain S-box-containing protein